MFSAFSCAACELPFQATKDKQPVLLCCGHTACPACCAAFTIPGPPCCPVCKVDEPGDADHAQYLAISAKLLPLMDTLVEAQKKLLTAQHAIQSGIAKLRADAPGLADCYRSTVDTLIAGLCAQRDNTLDEFTTVCADRTKKLQAQADELEVSAGQLSACIAQGHAAAARAIPLGVDHALETTQSMLVLGQTALWLRVPAQLQILVCTEPVVCAVSGLSKLCLYEVDHARTIATGSGLTWFSRIAPNVFSVVCKDGDGLPAFWVTAADVFLRVSTTLEGNLAGHLESVEVIEPGKLQLTYAVDDEGVVEIVLSVSVCGVPVAGGPWLARSGCFAMGVHVATLPLAHAVGSRVLAFSTDGSLMVVLNKFTDHNLSVHRASDCSLIRFIGSRGTAPGCFLYLSGLCVTANDTLLVAEFGNQRIQEVTLEGTHVKFVVGGGLSNLALLAMHNDVVAAGMLDEGTRSTCVRLFSYTSGALLSQCGVPPCHEVFFPASGLHFTPDGKHLYVGDLLHGRLALVTVEGAFVRFIGMGVLGAGEKSITLTCTGDVVVADLYRHRMCVFSGDDGTMLRTWGTPGLNDGQFAKPRLLAVNGSRLYVLDRECARLQVFE